MPVTVVSIQMHKYAKSLKIGSSGKVDADEVMVK
jgi:hypothetical protein